MTGIISAIIGAFVAAWTAIYQINKNKEIADKRNNDNLRIQNMPILNYEIKPVVITFPNLDDIISFQIEDSIKTANQTIEIEIKNISNNSVKDLCVELNNIDTDTKCYLVKDNEVILIEKESSKKYDIALTMDNEKIYSFVLKIRYQDVLNNWYGQIVNFQYKPIQNFAGKIDKKIEKEYIIDNNV